VDTTVEAHRTWAVEGAGVGPCTQPMPFADKAAKKTRGPGPLGPLAWNSHGLADNSSSVTQN